MTPVMVGKVRTMPVVDGVLDDGVAEADVMETVVLDKAAEVVDKDVGLDVTAVVDEVGTGETVTVAVSPSMSTMETVVGTDCVIVCVLGAAVRVMTRVVGASVLTIVSVSVFGVLGTVT